MKKIISFMLALAITISCTFALTGYPKITRNHGESDVIIMNKKHKR